MRRRVYQLVLSAFAILGAGLAQQSPYTDLHPRVAVAQQSPYTALHPSMNPTGEMLEIYFQQPQSQVPQARGGMQARGGPQLRQLLNQFGDASLMRMGPAQGRWWNMTHWIDLLGLSPEQIRKMDDIFQQHRIHLIDLNASLEKEEATLEPLVSADQPDDGKVLAEIDKVAQARAELEKANSRMLWSIRRVLTQDQWKKLESTPGRGGRLPAPAKQ